MLKRFFLALILVLFAGCTYTNAGIFYSIEKEVFIPNASDSLKNNITITGLARLGNTTYVAAYSLFKKSDTDSDWSKLVPSEWGSNFNRVLSLSGDANRLYAVVSNSDATQTKLMNFNGTTWAQSTGSLTGKAVTVTPIYDNTGGVSGMYLSVHKSDNTYDIHDINTTTGNINAAISLGSEATTLPVQAAAFGGGFYFLTFGDGRLFRGSTINNLTKLTYSFGADLGAVSTLNTFPVSSAVFVTLANGRVAWSTDNGNTWTQSSPYTKPTNDSPLRLGLIFKLHEVTVAGSLAQGSQGGGLIEIVSDGGTGAKIQALSSSTTDTANYNSTELSSSTVTSFLIQGTKTYVGTMGKGLFRQDSDKKWTWE